MIDGEGEAEQEFLFGNPGWSFLVVCDKDESEGFLFFFPFPICVISAELGGVGGGVKGAPLAMAPPLPILPIEASGEEIAPLPLPPPACSDLDSLLLRLIISPASEGTNLPTCKDPKLPSPA